MPAPHYPANPNKFEFDATVANIFPDMALRAIPMYLETHRLHAGLCRSLVETTVRKSRPLTILDVGASRGGFLKAMQETYPDVFDQFYIRAIDYSQPMVDLLEKDFPTANAECLDITSQEFMDDQNKYDVINCSYIIQFIRPDLQADVLRKLSSLLTQKGLLFVSQKSAIEGDKSDSFNELYFDFRRHNGYSDEEIQAKTIALKNSMWPIPHRQTTRYLQACGLRAQDTARWLMFNSVVCSW